MALAARAFSFMAIQYILMKKSRYRKQRWWAKFRRREEYGNRLMTENLEEVHKNSTRMTTAITYGENKSFSPFFKVVKMDTNMREAPWQKDWLSL